MGRSITRGDMARQLGCSLQFLALIETHGRYLPPNHPLVPKMAEILGLTLPEIHTFCKHEPFTESQIKLAESRLGTKEQADGTFRRAAAVPKALPAGDVAAAIEGEVDEDHHINKAGVIVPNRQRRGRVSHVPYGQRVTSLRARRLALGLNYVKLAAALGVDQAFVYRTVDNPKALAPNHPLIPKIASVLKLSEAEVRRHAKRPRMTDMAINSALAKMGRQHPGRNGGKQKTQPAKKPAKKPAKQPDEKQEPGTALVPVSTKGRKSTGLSVHDAKRAYNALRLMDPETRQCARSLAMATTLAAMKGKKFLDVAVPTEGMAMILNDWLRLKGIPEIVVLAVDYDKVFG
jgi:transcriptional regulator with XRE-family HTH domain